MRTRQVAGRVYNYERCFGRNAQAGAGFQLPMDFALGSDESIYVVSRSHEFAPGWGISKCTLEHEFIWDDRGVNFQGGQSPWPMSVDVDSNENVYVSDDYTSRISIFDKDGNSMSHWGTKGSGTGELNGPSGLAFDKDDNLYIVDSLNHRVQKFTKDGKPLAMWGSQGSGESEFNMPWGIDIDKQGDVYVADWKNDRVQKFSPEGTYLASFGGPGAGDGEFQRPTDVAIDEDGDVYVTDWRNHRLNIYTADGTFITAFTGDAESLSHWAQAVVEANPDYQKARRRADLTPEFGFNRPVAVNVDPRGRIMVLEANRHRLQIYVKERDFVDAPFNL